MIGFIIALRSETNKFGKKKNSIQKVNNAILMFSGVGKTNAASAAQKMIDKHRVNQIINIGSCGAINKEVKVTDIIVVNKLSYYDVDVTCFGYKINQLPQEPKEYKISYQKLFNQLKENKCLDNNIVVGKIATGETFVTSNNKQKFVFNKNVLAVDMEATAIAQVCTKNKIEFNALKIVSDTIKTKDNEKEWINNMRNIKNVIDELIISLSH